MSLPLNEIIHGDCLEVMRGWPSECIDLTVTSPPYDNLRTYNGFSFDFEGIAQELYRITKQGGVVAWVVGDATVNGSETGTSFKQALYFKEIGFNFHDTMIFAKKDPVPNDGRQNRYIQQFEYMFILSRGKPKTCNYRTEPCVRAGKKSTLGTQRKADGTLRQDRKINRVGTTVKQQKARTNIWYYATGGRQIHPASFPERLAEDHILTWSNEGDIVLDPMCGSGTTCKMAMETGRDYIGIDISEEYCEMARKRIAEHTAQQNIFSPGVE